jgi:hypothetical protein
MTFHIHFTLLNYIAKICFTMVSANRSTRGDRMCKLDDMWLASIYVHTTCDDRREKKEGRCNNFQRVHIITFWRVDITSENTSRIALHLLKTETWIEGLHFATILSMFFIRYFMKNERNKLFKINLKMHTLFILVQTSQRIKVICPMSLCWFSVYDERIAGICNEPVCTNCQPMASLGIRVIYL